VRTVLHFQCPPVGIQVAFDAVNPADEPHLWLQPAKEVSFSALLWFYPVGPQEKGEMGG